MPTLEDRLRALAREGDLCDKLPDGGVRCWACGHECLVKPGRAGVCRVRYNEGGRLMVPFGYVGAEQVDPVEKKPFFHVLPGSKALSFGMLGCDYHCTYCQNWLTSQALRDPDAVSPVEERTPEELVRSAKRARAPLIVSTYNEPLITSEWSLAVFEEARKEGLRCGYVSNGNGTRKVLERLRPLVDCYKVDLKGFDDRRYRSLMGGVLAN
ncbi:MAG: radical SAM protein, partial [Elusimicrobia bacterium]|nr:radical SAM protein [Elusimicrobiota bacterium]